jgi:hypothetical protein
MALFCSSSDFVVNVPKMRHSDPGSQPGMLLPLIAIDPVGANCTPLFALEAPLGGDV